MRLALPLALVAALQLLAPRAAAQPSSGPSGHVAEDFLLSDVASSPVEESSIVERKSVLLAGALSAIVPGAGQVYAEAPWWRAAIYAGLEAIGWTAYAVTSSEGARRTDEFEGFADAHWSVSRYIDWLGANYLRWSDSAVNKEVVADALARIYTSSDQSRPDWERVDFEQLNRIERAVRGGFSHTLPGHGEQQYYEQIGKYVQYRSGWDDHGRGADTLIYDPSHVTERNELYMQKRADANDYLGYASAVLGGIIVNHLASLLDAALAARGYNTTIRGELKGSLLPDGSQPLNATLSMTIRF